MATGNSINANSSGIARYDGAGSWTGLTVTQHATLVGGASNGITSIVQGAGQLLIGTTASDPSAASLSAGTGVSITSASGAITINAVGSGLTWTVVTGTTQTAAINSGYIANNAGQVVVTLPTTAAVGSIVAVTGMNNATGWQIAQSSGQQVFFGTASTTSGATGTLTSTNTRDTVVLLCVVANNTFNVIKSIGNITVV